VAQRGAWTPDKVRQRIRTSMLARRLFDHALGKIELSQTQVKSIEILLRKTMPDLSAIEHSGEIKQRDITAEPLTAAEWEERYSLEAPTGTSESSH
jgi:hypothetical protein